MEWSLKWGDHIKAFELQAKKSKIVPKPLRDRPRLQKQDLPFYEAFSILSKARQHGTGGNQPIQISEVKAYCELVGIASIRSRSKYLSLVQELDHICLDHWAEKQKQAAT